MRLLKSNLLLILELELIDKSFSEAKVFGQQTGSPLNLPWAPQPQCSIKKPPQIAKNRLFSLRNSTISKKLYERKRSPIDLRYKRNYFNFFCLNYDSKGQTQNLSVNKLTRYILTWGLLSQKISQIDHFRVYSNISEQG